MTLKFLAAGLMAATLIGCADAIEVPDDKPSVFTQKSMVYTKYDVDNQNEDYSRMMLSDSTGENITDLGSGIIGGTGANRIVYVVTDKSQLDGGGDVMVCNRDGSGARVVATVLRSAGRKFAGFPTISADGRVIAYATRDSISVNPNTEYKRVLHVVDGNGVDRVITEDLAYETLFGLSPDGSKIAYFDDGEGSGSQSNASLRVARTDGSGSQILRSDVNPMHDYASTIEWSPDGNRIAFASEGAEFYRVQVINQDGTQYIDVGTGLFPTWSPDGTKLAWTGASKSGDNPDIVMTSDMGVTVEYVTQAAEGESHPQFSPDGKKILCMMWIGQTQESPGRLKVIDLASRESRTIGEQAMTGFWVK